MKNDVANTIFQQLGGRQFARMTGANNFAADDFRLPGGGGFCRDGINYVKITLTPMDVYTMEFSRIRGTTVTTVTTLEDIYCDTLREQFTEITGLEVRVPKVRTV